MSSLSEQIAGGERSIRGVMEGDSTPSEFIPRLAALNASAERLYRNFRAAAS